MHAALVLGLLALALPAVHGQSPTTACEAGHAIGFTTFVNSACPVGSVKTEVLKVANAQACVELCHGSATCDAAEYFISSPYLTSSVNDPQKCTQCQVTAASTWRMYAANGHASATANLYIKGYTPAKQCVPCPVSTYKPGTALMPCLACPPLTHAPGPGNSTCACVAGAVATSSSTPSSPQCECDAGHSEVMRDAFDVHAYRECEDRNEISTTEAGSLAACQAACLAQSGCTSFEYFPRSTTTSITSTIFSAGQHYQRCQLSSSCTNASDARDSNSDLYVRKQESDKCEVCPVSTYKPSSGAGSCLACPPLTNATEPGSITCTCVAGANATNSSTPANPQCECPAGYFGGAFTQRNSVGWGLDANYTCKACPASKYKSSSDTCTDCPDGSGSAAASDAEDDCIADAGFTGSGSGVAPCAAGKFKAAASSAANCTHCAAGKYGAFVYQRSDTCTPCEAGKFNAATGQGQYIEGFKPGQVMSNLVQLSCIWCDGSRGYSANPYRDGYPAGGIAPNTGSTNCTACPVGFIPNDSPNRYTRCKANVTEAPAPAPAPLPAPAPCAPELTALNNSVVHRGVFGETLPQIQLQVLCAEGLALALNSLSGVVITVAGGDTGVRLEGPSEYRLQGPSNDVAVIDNTSVVRRNNSAASDDVPVSLTFSLGSDSSISVVVKFILSSPVMADVMGVLAMTAAEAKVVGQVVAGLVAAAVTGAVAASAAGAVGGGAGAGGGGAGGGGAGGAAAAPVQFLIAKTQICSLAGDIRLDLGAPHAGFTGMFGAANLQPGEGSPDAEKLLLLGADDDNSESTLIEDVLNPKDPDPEDPAALQRALIFTIVVSLSALLIPLILALVTFGLGYACLKAAGRSGTSLFHSVKGVTLFVEALVMNTLSMGASLVSMLVFKTADKQTPVYIVVACVTVIIFLVGWNVFLAKQLNKNVKATHYTESESMRGHCCSSQTSPESQVAPEKQNSHSPGPDGCDSDDEQLRAADDEQLRADDDDQLRAAFCLFDTDKSGYLDKAEFQYIMTLTSPQAGPGEVGVDPLDDTEFEKIFADVDTDGSGNISVDEYLAWVKAGREYKNSGVTTKASASTENRSLSAAVASALVSPADVSAGQVDDAAEKKKNSSRPSMLCCGWKEPGGEWTTEHNDATIALGSYYLRFRFSSRFYFVAFNFKQVMMGVAIIFLPPVPSLWLMLSCEIIHGAGVMWTMPFLVVWDHLSAMGSCIIFTFFYILILTTVMGGPQQSQLLGDTGSAEPAPGSASSISSLLVLSHLLVLLMQLCVQFAPILEGITACGGYCYEFIDTSSRAGAGESTTDASTTKQNRHKLTRLKLATLRHVTAAPGARSADS